MIFPFVYLVSPIGKPGRRSEAGAAQERIRVVDAVVDDSDLHAFAVQAGGGVEHVGADDARAAVQREVVRHARPHAADVALARELRQLLAGIETVIPLRMTW